MKIETKFGLGDKVYKIGYDRKEEMVDCPVCGGTGQLDGKDGSKHGCPKCFGNGHGFVCRGKKWQILQQLTLGQVTVTIRKSQGMPGSMFDNYKSQKTERYMAEETGIGSGSFYYSKDLFFSKEEAQAECDRRNTEREEAPKP